MRLLIATLALTLTACGGAGSGDSATGFITPGSAIPASADTDAGDIPRDDYGRPFTYAFLGQALPDFSGTMVSGEAFSSSDLDGQWTVIDVWGLWCGDCMADAPYVAALASAISQDPDLRFMSIHTPPNANRIDDAFGRYQNVQAYFDDKGYSYPTLLDEDASIRDDLDIAWTPSYLLVAPDGTVQGYRSELSAADGEPVKDFLRDIADVKKAYTPG
ncbi:MAG: TlpA disulfide reductase family protein [Henriciella sp.]|uniref:TlpA family protein disulfide reductase n=1 Tax=Henriciella sp. TaxID=1968823 RepID=UPI003C7800A7